MNNVQLGAKGEEVALQFLLKRGYSILEKNFRLRMGEIDIIASKGGCIIFAEVKSRRSLSFGYPCEAVDLRKQRKILLVAKSYIHMKRLYDADCRFDIIEVYINEKKVNHIEGAFCE